MISPGGLHLKMILDQSYTLRDFFRVPERSDEAGTAVESVDVVKYPRVPTSEVRRSDRGRSSPARLSADLSWSWPRSLFFGN